MRQFSCVIKRSPVLLAVGTRAFASQTKQKPSGRYDCIVIGGGHNGLVAAAYLAKSGKRVCVLERRHLVGGAAVTEEIVPGFKFSRASYVLGLLRPHIYADLQLEKHGLRVLTRNPSSYTPIHQSLWCDTKAKSLCLGAEALKNQKEISKFSARDAQKYPEYERFLNTFIDCLTPLLDSAPPRLRHFTLASPFQKIRQLSQFKPLVKAVMNLGVNAPGLLQVLTAPTTKILNQWFESEPLKATLATDSVIGAMISPSSPGSGYVLLHHVMAQVNGIKGCWGYPVGGMGAVTQAMAKSCEAAGVKLFVEQPVEQILLDSNNAACGVRIQNGNEVYADHILSNATPKVTFLDLLPPNCLPKQFEDEIRSIDYTSPVCKINVALKELPNFAADPNTHRSKAEPHHQCTIHLNCEDTELIEDAYQDAKNGRLPDKPMIEMTLPSSLDPTIAPKGCHVALIFTQYVPFLFPDGKQWDDSLKTIYAEKVFNSVEEYAPGFKESLIDYEVLPPPDLESIFGLTGGNIFHGAMSLDQLYFSRPSPFQASPATPVAGLFLCGSGAHPGGGVMGSPGYLAAKEITTG